MRPALILSAAAFFALSACGTGTGDEAQSDVAAGQVEGGEISDAMLPFDSLRSTSPADQGATTQRESSEPGTRLAPTSSNLPAPPPSPTASSSPQAEEPVEPQPE